MPDSQNQSVSEMVKRTIATGTFLQLYGEGVTGEIIELGRHKWELWLSGPKTGLIFFRTTEDDDKICFHYDFGTSRELPILKWSLMNGNYDPHLCRSGGLGLFFYDDDGKIHQTSPDSNHVSWGALPLTDYGVGSTRIATVQGNKFFVIRKIGGNSEEEINLGVHPHNQWGFDRNDDIVIRRGKEFFRILLDGTEMYAGQYEFDSCDIGKCGRFNIIIRRGDSFFGVYLDGKRPEEFIGRYRFNYDDSDEEGAWVTGPEGIFLAADNRNITNTDIPTEFLLMIVK